MGGPPPLPVFSTGKPSATGANQNNSAATPVATSLGLPDENLKPQVPHPPPLEFITASETDTVPGSPITRSPSTSISALSDFMIEDTSDEEPLVGPTTISTLRTGTSRCCAGIRCSVSIPASCHFVLLPFVRYSPRPAWQRQNLPTTVPVFFPQTRQQISRTEQSAGFRNIHRITAEYEMPAVRSPLLGAVRGAYSETFEGLDPSKALGECFQRAGPTRARSSTCSFGRNSSSSNKGSDHTPRDGAEGNPPIGPWTRSRSPMYLDRPPFT